MRKKDIILDEARRDIQTRETNADAPLWIEYRKLEVLIDTRDTLKDIMRAFIISNEAKFPK